MYTIIYCINMSDYMFINKYMLTHAQKIVLKGLHRPVILVIPPGDLECGEGHFASLLLFFYII